MRIKVLLSIFVCLCLGFGIIYFKQDDKKEKKEVVNTNYQTVVFRDDDNMLVPIEIDLKQNLEDDSKYRNLINNILDKSSGVVYFDFLHTSFIDSSGIGLVLGRYNQLKNENRKLVLANLSKTAYKVFELSGMFALMEYVEGVKE